MTGGRSKHLTVAYADPPYLGSARRHYGALHEQAGVYDTLAGHAALLARLQLEYPDGWAYSCTSTSLRQILPLCPGDVRVAAWVKPFCSWKSGVNPAYCWEPVVFRGGRQGRDRPTTWKVRDFVSANVTLKTGLVGSKPEKFALWLFDLLGLGPGDNLVDVFPGSGAVGRAWGKWLVTTGETA